jgi:hypothetical protein
MSSEIGVLYCCDVFMLGAKNSDYFKLNHWTIVKKTRFRGFEQLQYTKQHILNI